MITSKLANATVANMNSLYATTLTAGTNFYMGNSIVTSHGVSFGGGSMKFSYLTTATADATVVASDLPHYHTVSFSNGQFTLGGVTDTAPGPFDITATTWYKNQIAAAKNSVYVIKGWEENVCSCIPSEGTGAGAYITLSQTTENPVSATPNLYRVTVKDGNTTVLYFTVDASSRYDAGETAGYTDGYSDGVNDGYATGAASVTVTAGSITVTG